MAIAESIKYRDKSQSTPAILQNAMPPSSLQDIMYGPEVQRDLHVDMNEITGGYEENDDPIRVGDIVEKFKYIYELKLILNFRYIKSHALT
jgi:hypothetical protein